MKNDMKIAIIGTGGAGGYFGGKLAQAGFDVTFLARGKHLSAIKEKGLTVKSILGDFHVAQAKATDKITEIGKVDLIILGVKAWQIKELSAELIPLLHAKSLILPLQNGVLATEELTEKIDASHVLGGVCRIISKIESPGVINHFAAQPSIIFGKINEPVSAQMLDVKSVFDTVGIDSKISDDIASEIWKKFAFICVGGLLAITGQTLGELRTLEETREMMIKLLAEIHLLSTKTGISIGTDYVEKTVAFIDALPMDSTFSLARDIWENRPSEIDYQNGSVVRLGERYAVETPLNKFVYHSILPKELKARKEK